MKKICEISLDPNNTANDLNIIDVDTFLNMLEPAQEVARFYNNWYLLKQNDFYILEHDGIEMLSGTAQEIMEELKRWSIEVDSKNSFMLGMKNHFTEQIQLLENDWRKKTIEECEELRKEFLKDAEYKILKYNKNLFEEYETTKRIVVNTDFGTYTKDVSTTGVIAKEILNNISSTFLKRGEEEATKLLNYLLKDYRRL